MQEVWPGDHTGRVAEGAPNKASEVQHPKPLLSRRSLSFTDLELTSEAGGRCWFSLYRLIDAAGWCIVPGTGGRTGGQMRNQSFPTTQRFGHSHERRRVDLSLLHVGVRACFRAPCGSVPISS